MSDLTAHLTTTLRKLGAPDLSIAAIVRRVERLELLVEQRETTIRERDDEIASLRAQLTTASFDARRAEMALATERRVSEALAEALNKDGVRQAHQAAVERGLGT